MPTAEQLQRLWLISDSVLYPEAVNFIQRLVYDDEINPLPLSQINGLFNISNSASYPDLLHFIKHQRDRNWSESKQDIKIFYTELEKLLTSIRNKRVRDEFQLVQAQGPARVVQQEMDDIMILLAREFIQHLLAENDLLATKVKSGKGRQ